MKAKTIDGLLTELTQDTLDGLKMQVRGPVILPGDVRYEDSRTVWNAMIDRKPAFVIRCIGFADVIACVEFAKEHKLLLCIKGGGHMMMCSCSRDTQKYYQGKQKPNPFLQITSI